MDGGVPDPMVGDIPIVTKKHSNRSALLALVMGVVIISGLITSLVSMAKEEFTGFGQNALEQLEELSRSLEQSTPTVAPEQTTLSITPKELIGGPFVDTRNWRTFLSEEGSFKFQYPTGWSKNATYLSWSSSFSESQRKQVVVEVSSSGGERKFSVTSSPLQLCGNLDLPYDEVIDVGGAEWRRIITDTANSEGNSYQRQAYLTQYQGWCYRIETWQLEGVTSQDLVLDQILETFEFIKDA